MNDDYKTIRTSAEVWAVIRARHPDMVVFSSYSKSNGGLMFTSYGFKGCDSPFIQAETTWDIDTEDVTHRINEKHEYWLCLSKREEA